MVTRLCLLALLLNGCTGVNAWIAGAEHQVISDAAGAADNAHTANVAAAAAWKRTACALTLGGISGVGDPALVQAALLACPVADLGLVKLNGATISLTVPSLPSPDPKTVTAAHP